MPITGNSEAPLFTVVIPTYNRWEVLSRTLSYLAMQIAEFSWEVVVVQHRCTDRTDEVCRRPFPVPLRTVRLGDRPGVAAARNAGAAEATGTFLLFLDDDILVEPDFLTRHRDALEKHPGSWIIGQAVNLPEQERTPFGRFRKALGSHDLATEPARESDGLTGANVSLPLADFKRLGGFDEAFQVASTEDLELAVRARKAGITIKYLPSIIVTHNDWAGFTIRDYCHRQRTYSQCEALLWHRHGSEYPRTSLLLDNLPPAWRRDPLRTLLRKCAKQFLAARGTQMVLLGASAACEKICPWPPLLWRVYRALLAGAIYRGIQEGLEIYGPIQSESFSTVA